MDRGLGERLFKFAIDLIKFLSTIKIDVMKIITLFLIVFPAFWKPIYPGEPGDQKIGITLHNIEKTGDSYRLYSSRNLTAAHLISPEGKYIHTWYYPHAEDVATNTYSGFGMAWHYAEMLPNGNLIAIVKDEMIIELDWNSKLVWKAKLRAHHDFARGTEGNTIVVSRNDRPNPWYPGQTISMDELVEFDKKGKVVWRWDYTDHYSDIKEMRDSLPPEEWRPDWPHINTCEILPENPLEEKDPRFEAGNLLLCGAHANVIMILDRKSEKIVWAWGPGIIEGGHMPTMLPNGNILMYDNGHHRKYTKVIELDPIKKEVVWEYGSNREFYSPARGSGLKMKGGNYLIANSDYGWFFEVTPEGEKVWEYYNPDLTRGGARMGLYRTLPYEKELVNSLLSKHGRMYFARNNKAGYAQKYGLSDQLMVLVDWIESGDFDRAHRWLNEGGQKTLNEKESGFAYSLLYAARKDVKKSMESAKRSIDAGMSGAMFSQKFSFVFRPLT